MSFDTWKTAVPDDDRYADRCDLCGGDREHCTHDDGLRQCDCCARYMPCVIGPKWVAGIETYACHICRGWTVEDCDECRERIADQVTA